MIPDKHLFLPRIRSTAKLILTTLFALHLLPTATLSVAPDQSQFFQYDRISLSCVANSTGWIVKRNTLQRTAQKCQRGWAIQRGSSCIIENAYPADTGAYWCESPQGECSNTVNITVKAHGVILKSPLHPVEEGKDVTLRCSYRREEEEEETSDFPANFFKNGVFNGGQTSAELTLNAVSKSNHAGFYKCEHPTKGYSPESLLTVKARAPPILSPTPAPPPQAFPWIRVICSVLLFILYNIILILCVYMYRKWARARADAKL
ncbi:low affinity immunoglobulin gamma Fc region receptor II-a-like [Leuresthes tenuis]|uniref:low affinity immunoglobulin gamma Fc region receptor II-a-like n=1 Tax=Leuresthes tenuis TaxID=355514 RepID=UPI003B513265